MHDNREDHAPASHADEAQSHDRPASFTSAIAVPLVALGLLAAAVWFGSSPAPAPPQLAGGLAAVDADPLPSWKDGPTKHAILEFVAAVTRQGAASFVPVSERIAVFDHDGTLVCEKPIVHGMFLVDRIRALAERQPEIAHEEPFASLIAGDVDFVRRLGKKFFIDLTFATLAGVPEERLEAEARDFIRTARHPVFDVPLGETTFQPMKELMALLKAKGFSVWICSGSGVHFMRPAAEEWYGIGPERVIASRPASVMREIDEVELGPGDSPNKRLDLVVLPEVDVLNDEDRKPVSIGERIGRRPIFAAGNVGTAGDIEMLRWSQSGDRPNFQLIVLHDDAEREMAYGEPSGASLKAAEKYGWHVVRIAEDWARVFARPLEKKPASPVASAATATSAAPAAPAAGSPAVPVQPPAAAVTPAPATPPSSNPPSSTQAPAPSPPSPPTANVSAAVSTPAPVASAPLVTAAERAEPGKDAAPWEKEIAAYEESERESPPQAAGVVILGSSNIRMWTTLADDFPGMNVLNRGVSGCRLAELAAFAPRLVAAAKPRVIAISAGTNDIAAGATTEEIRGAFGTLVATLRSAAPEATIVFLAISPTVKRWDQLDRQVEANAAIRAFIEAEARDGDLVYLDTSAAFLGPDGKPAAECFLDDLQHPSTIGNARRAELMRPVLRRLLAE